MATRRTQEEQRAIYEAWHQSGLTRTVFCRQNHISLASMWRWGKKFKMDVSCKSTVSADTLSPSIAKDIKFYPVGEVENTKQDSNLEITLPNGICCKVYLPVAGINKLLQGLLK